MKAQRLEKEFRQRASNGNQGRLLLRAADAIELVSRAAEEGVPILGVSAGDAPSGGKDVSTDRADYSAAVSQGHGCWAEAEAFIREKSSKAFQFEVVLGDDPVEAV